MLNALIYLIAYAVLSFSTLLALGWMVLRIGGLMGDCPAARDRAKAASVTIATGYIAIGAGGVVLGGAGVVFLGGQLAVALAMLGLVVLCLGLGFSNAISTLRAVLAPPAPAKEPQLPLEPVLD
ncbi:MAG: hypothetical protein AAGL89_14490 [Pseudomonadota bacterium]